MMFNRYGNPSTSVCIWPESGEPLYFAAAGRAVAGHLDVDAEIEKVFPLMRKPYVITGAPWPTFGYRDNDPRRWPNCAISDFRRGIVGVLDRIGITNVDIRDAIINAFGALTWRPEDHITLQNLLDAAIDEHDRQVSTTQ